jgi:hypothetical protein
MTRATVYGEYPYYRADRAHWAGDLRAMADAGVDVVSCYVPWRWHELAPGEYDFTGRTHAQRDVTGFLRLVADAGLRALVKPGPFVHAEVQLGGLPDRVSPSHRPDYPAVLDAGGEPATSQGLSLPSLSGAAFRAEVRDWLSAVDREVLSPAVYPNGPVVAVQVGNEGVYSDANQPVWRHDFSAVDAFADWSGMDTRDVPPLAWPAELRSAWARWSGEALRAAYGELSAGLPVLAKVEGLVNVPLPTTRGQDVAGWLLRTARLAGTGLTAGYTSWVGNCARSEPAFAANWFGVRARRLSNVESNWGFTWTDPTHAEPPTALFHALLSLGLGSTSCGVYTAVATDHWGPEIDLDAAALRREGLDPADYGPPYCPGAPLREGGGANPNLEALHQLRALVREHGDTLGRARYAPDVLLLVTEELAEAEAWPDGGASSTLSSALESAIGLGAALMADHQYVVDVITEATAPDPASEPGVPWLVPVVAGAEPHPLVAARQRAGGAVVRFTVADVDMVVRALPRARFAHPVSDPGTVLVHADESGRPVALFAFNPTDRPVVVRRTVKDTEGTEGTTVTVPLPPGGSACLVATPHGFSPAAQLHFENSLEVRG